jgi:glycosyltransferase involved in cell wall biosynthesis
LKVLFLTTAHKYNDDRIFYHQAVALAKHGFDVKICSLSADFLGIMDGIEIESYSILDQSSKQKEGTFLKVCKDFQPDAVICSEPLAVIAAGKYKKQNKTSIIYDITEWYPSFRMVENYSFLMKFVHAIKFFLIQLYAGFISTDFIFGEETKKFPLAYFFPFRKKLILPYYPDDKYIFKNIKKLEINKINLCYTGVFSEEKGVGNFFAAVDALEKKRPELKIEITLIGGSRKKKDDVYFAELLKKYNKENIKISKPISFEGFTQSYADADICFDLREINIENHHCLPIKIFYYAASGKPVIYTDLKATRQYVEVSKFGFLVDPKDSQQISNCIVKYLDNPKLYDSHAHNARSLYEEKYNWDVIKHSFVHFVSQSIT